jgi:hypothetical protein
VKRSRILTVVAATAAVVGTTFIGAGMANAATPVSTVNADGTDATWVNTPAQLGVEGATYPATGWFTGNVAPATAGTTTFGPNGVTLTGTTQLLTATSEAGTDLQDLVTDADFVSSGQVNFQIPMFLNTGGAAGADTNFTTLRPADFGTGDFVDGNGRWISTAAVGNIPAETAANLSDFEAQITTAAPNSEIIGYGFITPAGSTGTVSAVQFGGDSTYFTPTPGGEYQPTSLTLTAVKTTGFHVTGSGFFPGETVDIGFNVDGAQSGGPIEGLTFTASPTGTVDAQVVVPAQYVPAAGTYNVVLVGERSSVVLSGVVTVTADPAVVTPIAPVPTPVRAAATFAG